MITYKKYEPSERIIKECFWDYKISVADIKEYTSSNDWNLKKFIFEKIFCNSQSLIIDLMIFDKDDLEKLIRKYTIPQFNHDYLEKRHKIIRHVILNEKVRIKELEWRL
ncbi:MAG: hypothetical protein PHR06_03780 [Candidatus Cloacimonetes bacterium]|nr:hypothetical protein [Candidatus Cloacimonadota bacterium]